jgi:transposase
MAAQIGRDGRQVLDAIYAPTAPRWLREVPAVAVLHHVWIQQFVTVDGVLRMRTDRELPPAAQQIVSPYDAEARWSRKRNIAWTGYKLHLTETCTTHTPAFITHVTTTPATTQDVTMTRTIHADLAAQGLLPDEHVVDAAYTSAEVLVTGRTTHNLAVIGPMPADTSWQARAQQGYAVNCFAVDWDAQQVTCPQGKQSRIWRPGDDGCGHPINQQSPQAGGLPRRKASYP